MKKLLTLTLLIFFIGCETESINLDLGIETPELPTGEEETEENLITEALLDLELSFKANNSPFAEIVDLDPQCLEEAYLEKNSEFIVSAEATNPTTLSAIEWIKGIPNTESITFNGDPDISYGHSYEIYFNQVNGKFVTTCYEEGVIEIL
ncbi:MAG: hypothetical protein ACI9QC_000412 [Oceanicoccus sp.]|jgi:hypothetical protein